MPTQAESSPSGGQSKSGEVNPTLIKMKADLIILNPKAQGWNTLGLLSMILMQQVLR